jgi:hypothetical protein
MIHTEDVPLIQLSPSVRDSATELQKCALGLPQWLSRAGIQGRSGYAISTFKTLTAITLAGWSRIAEDYYLNVQSEVKLSAILADAGIGDDSTANAYIEKCRPVVEKWGRIALELTLDPAKTFEDLKSFFEEVEAMSP